MKQRLRFACAVAVLLSAFAAGGDVTAFVGVNVVPMDTLRVLDGQTVIVRDGRVETIGPVAEVAVPEDAQVVYGRGRWLMPGLIDMHVHIRAVDLPRYVENGITTVRDLAGLDSVLAIVQQRPFGPRIYVASKLLAGPNAQNPPFSLLVTNAADAQSIVDAQLGRGCDSIKVYDDITAAVYDALVNAAHARGVKVAGHVTRFVDIRHAMVMQDSIEHLAGYPLGDAALNRELAIASRESGVWNCPTMVVFTQYVTRSMEPSARQRLLADRRALLTALHDANTRILAGTDSGYLVPAGIALHDEFDELFAAGFSRFELLSAATRSAAEYLGDSSLGVIAPGSRADLVLANANPLEDHATLRTPAGVMLNGRWLAYDQRRRAARH
jgi:imidazolonepropionase-like amidohydrolase